MEKASGGKWAEAWRAEGRRGSKKGLFQGVREGGRERPMGTLPELRVHAPGEVRRDTSSARLVQETLADPVGQPSVSCPPAHAASQMLCEGSPVLWRRNVEVQVTQLLSVRP